MSAGIAVVGPVTAAARPDPEPHPPARGASPATIRRWLHRHDAARFVADHEAALDAAHTSLDLSEVHEIIKRQRGIAILQTDPEAYRRTSATPPSSPPASGHPTTNHSTSPPRRPAPNQVYVVEPVGDDFNQLKDRRGLATRYDKHALVFRGGLVLRAILLWLRPT